MSVTFKKILRKSPLDRSREGKYYPQITNFVEVMRGELYNGHAVNIENFGVFSLSATTVGSKEKKDCLPENIRMVRINFRASTSVRPNLAATRAEDRIDFVDLEQQLKTNADDESETPDPTPDGGGGEAPDPEL